MRLILVAAAFLVACTYAPQPAGTTADADENPGSDGPPPDTGSCVACGQFILAASADSYLRAQFPTETHESDVFQRCGSGDPANCCTNRAIYRFDLDALPAGCVIESATLNAYFYEQDYTNESPTLGVHRVAADWTEAQVSWNSRTASAWSSPGGDFDPTPVASIVVADGAFGFVTWDITPLASAWSTGAQPNFGAIVVQPGDLQGVIRGRKRFRTREAAETAERPFLAVTCTE